MSEGRYVLYDLNEKQGWLLSSFNDEKDIYYSPLLQLGRTNFVNPWQDKDFHYHTTSLEIYLLIEGTLWHVVNKIPIKMQGCSLLLVQPGIPHSIIGGEGIIHHYGMKVPHSNDKRTTSKTPTNINELKEKMKTLTKVKKLDPSVVFYIDFSKKENQNRWILGSGEALFKTYELNLAYMNFQNKGEFDKNQHPNDFHFHAKSTEWYLTIEGEQKLLVDDKKLSVPESYLLRILEHTPHKLLQYEYPFRGITIRTPNIPGDKIVLEEE